MACNTALLHEKGTTRFGIGIALDFLETFGLGALGVEISRNGMNFSLIFRLIAGRFVVG
ncbi:MAG: hypothetical protein ACKO9H_15015 [Planctomycetota bacterium]